MNDWTQDYLIVYEQDGGFRGERLMGETTLVDVEQALVNASNYLNGIEHVRDTSRFHALDAAIDTALRLVQAWIADEVSGGRGGHEGT